MTSKTIGHFFQISINLLFFLQTLLTKIVIENIFWVTTRATLIKVLEHKSLTASMSRVLSILISVLFWGKKNNNNNNNNGQVNCTDANRFGLLSLFNGISTFIGYLIPKLFS